MGNRKVAKVLPPWVALPRVEASAAKVLRQGWCNIRRLGVAKAVRAVKAVDGAPKEASRWLWCQYRCLRVVVLAEAGTKAGAKAGAKANSLIRRNGQGRKQLRRKFGLVDFR